MNVVYCVAAQRQQNSTMSLRQLAAATEYTRSSFSGHPYLSALPSSADAVVGQTTFRPVIAAAARSLLYGDRTSELLVGACPPTYDRPRPVSTSDDESCNLMTRKRRHGDSCDDAMTSSDDDEEIRTILCEEATTMTSRAPGNGALMTSEKRHCSPLLRARVAAAAAVVNDCSIVQRPSLNFYKMQVSWPFEYMLYVQLQTHRMTEAAVAPIFTARQHS